MSADDSRRLTCVVQFCRQIQLRNKMTKVAFLFGALLITNGLVGFFLSETTSVTALIPVIFGGIIFLCGLVSAVKESLAKHFMHVSAAIALLGGLAAGGRLASTLGADDPNRFVQGNLGAMALLCTGYVVACFQSFRAAGKARREAAGEE